jgi:hypothetical protein
MLRIFLRMAYDHCESRKSASSRGRFHPAPHEGMIFSTSKKKQAPGSQETCYLSFTRFVVCLQAFVNLYAKRDVFAFFHD